MASGRTWYRMVPVATCLAILLLFTLRWYTPSHQHFSAPVLQQRDRSRYITNITARANDRNDAIPGWSSPLSTYLVTPFEELDAKGKAVVVGKNMVCMLDEALENTHSPQSLYTDLQDLERTRYGWTYSRNALADHEEGFISEFGLHNVFVDLSISESKADWYQVSTAHSARSTANDVNYPPTWGTYQSLFNLRDGVIVATANYGPVWQNERDGSPIPANQIIPLRQWSDLVFLALQKTITDLNVGDIKNINHVFRHNLLNDQVKEALVMVTGGTSVYDYPGKVGNTHSLRLRTRLLDLRFKSSGRASATLSLKIRRLQH